MGNAGDVNNFRFLPLEWTFRSFRSRALRTARLAPPPEFANWRDEPGLRRVMYHGQPAWAVSRYQDIRAALLDPRLSADTIPDVASGRQVRDDNAPVMFARIDDPEHHRLRRMMTSSFTFRRTRSDAAADSGTGRPPPRRDDR